jgi:superfamily II DNA or RNA helicase
MSLSLFYQIVGRGMRIWPTKPNAWIIDLEGILTFWQDRNDENTN